MFGNILIEHSTFSLVLFEVCFNSKIALLNAFAFAQLNKMNYVEVKPTLIKIKWNYIEKMFPSQFHDTFLLLFKNNQSPVLTQLKVVEPLKCE